MPLRTLRKTDVGALEDWLQSVALAAGYATWSSQADLPREFGKSSALLYAEEAGSAFVSYAKKSSIRSFVSIEFIAVRPDQRGRGLATRAVLALERHLAPTVARLYVSVPSRVGLALYFWLRLGYRPLLKQDWPTDAKNSSVWMVRDLA